MTTQLHEWVSHDGDRYYWDLYVDGEFSSRAFGYYATTNQVYSWQYAPGVEVVKRPSVHSARRYVQQHYPGVGVVQGLPYDA